MLRRRSLFLEWHKIPRWVSMLRYYFKIFNINKEGEYLIHLNTKNNLENRIKRKKEKMLKNKKICDLLYKLNILKKIVFEK